jgi:hypothetical protein
MLVIDCTTEKRLWQEWRALQEPSDELEKKALTVVNRARNQRGGTRWWITDQPIVLREARKGEIKDETIDRVLLEFTEAHEQAEAAEAAWHVERDRILAMLDTEFRDKVRLDGWSWWQYRRSLGDELRSILRQTPGQLQLYVGRKLVEAIKGAVSIEAMTEIVALPPSLPQELLVEVLNNGLTDVFNELEYRFKDGDAPNTAYWIVN